MFQSLVDESKPGSFKELVYTNMVLYYRILGIAYRRNRDIYYGETKRWVEWWSRRPNPEQETVSEMNRRLFPRTDHGNLRTRVKNITNAQMNTYFAYQARRVGGEAVRVAWSYSSDGDNDNNDNDMSLLTQPDSTEDNDMSLLTQSDE